MGGFAAVGRLTWNYHHVTVLHYMELDGAPREYALIEGNGPEYDYYSETNLYLIEL